MNAFYGDMLAVDVNQNSERIQLQLVQFELQHFSKIVSLESKRSLDVRALYDAYKSARANVCGLINQETLTRIGYYFIYRETIVDLKSELVGIDKVDDLVIERSIDVSHAAAVDARASGPLRRAWAARVLLLSVTSSVLMDSVDEDFRVRWTK